jgi:glycosyltransferase involved in cell wall biosynthesis
MKVSVCLLTYNHAPYIRQALDSVLMQQADFAFEVCLGEDESSDGTREICIEYAERYPDLIRLFLRNRQDVVYIDGKPTGRFNFVQTLKACSGKYVALIDPKTSELPGLLPGSFDLRSRGPDSRRERKPPPVLFMATPCERNK